MRRQRLLLVTLMFLAACTANGPGTAETTMATTEAPSKVEPDIHGTITQVSAIRSTDAVAVIVIEATPSEAGGAMKDAVTITHTTEVVRRSGSSFVPADPAEILMTGRRVEAWYSGPVAESYPRQARASRIAILD